MKKTTLFALLLCLLSLSSRSQLMVSKLIGKDTKDFGLGYGLFTYLDIPLASGNQSVRVELADLSFYPLKGENLFTTTAGMKAYLSIKVGFKHVFSEDQNGFYLIPSAGYCRVVDVQEGQDATYGDGFAAALEGGYSIGVGEKGHSINLGLKFETDRGGKNYVLNNVGFRVSYAFNLFGKKE